MKQPELKRKMFHFWSSDKGYFESARNTNVSYQDEGHEEHRLALGYISQGAKVLDVGCGTAEAGRDISRFAHYHGVDVSPLGLSMAKDYKNDSFELLRCDVASLPFADGAFDVILSLYALEHFIEPLKTLQEMDRVLKTGGTMILISAAYDCLLRTPPSIGLGAISKMRSTYKGKRFSFLNIPIAAAYTWARSKYILGQLCRQLALYFKKDAYSFSLVSNPLCLNTEYSMDNDVVYIVSVREIVNWLRFNRGYQILYVNKRKTRFRFAEFLVENLFVVAKK